MPVRLPYKTGIKLQSSAIMFINYSPRQKILEIEFINGGVYWYKNVSLAVWERFLAIIAKGESAGEFVNKQIKAHYDFEEIN